MLGVKDFSLRVMELIRFFQVSPYVAVLGSPPPLELDQQLDSILAQGEATTLPNLILSSLNARRAQASQIAPWVEGYCPRRKRGNQ
jgi:hypothetical protein